MLRKFRKPVAFVSAVVMTLTLLLYLPVGTFTSNDYGTFVKAEETTTDDDNGFLENGSYEEAVVITDDNYKDYGFTDENYNSYLGYYAISNAGQLYWFASQVNSGNTSYKAVLTKNIIVNDDISVATGRKDWTPIGGEQGYSGTFDGQGHTISGLYYNSSEDNESIGLITRNRGTIKNVGVINSSFTTGEGNIGGIVGYNYGIIENCYFVGDVKGDSTVGGIVGQTQWGNAKIENCYFNGNVIYAEYTACVGGIAGEVGYSNIINCYSAGKITRSGDRGNPYMGGIIGFLVGDNYGEENYVVKNCYFDSTMYNGDAIGGTRLYEEEKVSNVVGKTETQFKSGEVAYLLQNAQNDQTTIVWGQNIDNDKTKQDYPVLGGAKVYQTTLSDGENYTNNSELLAKVAGYTLTLDGSIGVNFYMSLADKIITNDDAYVKFTYDNKTQIVKVCEAIKSSDEKYYVFTCDVAAAEMTMEITAQLFSGDYTSAEYKFTVQDYAKYILDNSSDFENSATLVPLVKAMLNYGANAQKYFNKNTDKLANSILAESDKTLSDLTASNLETNYKPVLENGESVGKFTSYYLNLSSETSIKVKFTPTSGVDMSKVKFYIDGNEVTNVTKLSDGKYLVVKSNISAQNLGTNYTFKAFYTDGDTTYTSSVTVSALSYVYTVLNADTSAVTQDLVNTMIALYDYNQKALAYVKANSTEE